MRDSICIFAFGENDCVARSSPCEQPAPRQVALDGFKSPTTTNKNSRYPVGYLLFLKTNPNFDTNAPLFKVRGCKVILGGAFYAGGGKYGKSVLVSAFFQKML